MSMRRAMQASVDEVGAAAAADGIDCRYEKGGTIVAARSAAQVQRSTDEIDEARAFGLGEEDLRWLDAGEATKVLGAQGVLGATFTRTVRLSTRRDSCVASPTRSSGAA